MKKLNALLHDVTIVNFSLIAKMVVRYRKVSLVAVVAVFSIIPYLYFTQVVIQQKQVFFKVNSQTGEANSNSLTNILDSGTQFLKKPEIMAVVNTYDFKTIMAQHLVSSPDFKKYDFNSTAQNVGGVSSALESCSDDNCKVNVLRDTIPGMFSLDSELGTDRFSLVITTRSAKTTMAILGSFQVALDKVRLQNAISSIEDQIKQIQELITKSRTELENTSGFVKVAESESLDASIYQHKDKIKNLIDRLNRESDQQSFQQIRLKESNLTANSNIDSDEKLGYEKFSKTNRRIEELRQNIGALNSTPPANRTPSDERVLAELKVELKKNESELRKMGDLKRNIAYEDSFINTQINNQSSFAFDYKVSSAKVKSLQKEYDRSKKELDQLFELKAKMDNELLALKPDLEYLKLLESKFVALKMKKSAITSDVYFDHYGPDVMSFKRSSLIQISAFSILFIAFFLFIALIVVYLRDDRIYDEFEIEKCCDDLQIIGEVPHFD